MGAARVEDRKQIVQDSRQRRRAMKDIGFRSRRCAVSLIAIFTVLATIDRLVGRPRRLR